MNRQPINARRSLARAESRAAKALEAKDRTPRGYRNNAAGRLKKAVTAALKAYVRLTLADQSAAPSVGKEA